MASAELIRDHGVERERQKACRRRYARSLHDHSAVMQRRAGTKDRDQKVVAQGRIEWDAALNVGAQAYGALENNQGANPIL